MVRPSSPSFIPLSPFLAPKTRIIRLQLDHCRRKNVAKIKLRTMISRCIKNERKSKSNRIYTMLILCVMTDRRVEREQKKIIPREQGPRLRGREDKKPCATWSMDYFILHGDWTSVRLKKMGSTLRGLMGFCLRNDVGWGDNVNKIKRSFKSVCMPCVRLFLDRDLSFCNGATSGSGPSKRVLRGPAQAEVRIGTDADRQEIGAENNKTSRGSPVNGSSLVQKPTEYEVHISVILCRDRINPYWGQLMSLFYRRNKLRKMGASREAEGTGRTNKQRKSGGRCHGRGGFLSELVPRSAFGVWGSPAAGYAVFHSAQPP